jgi:hypothetical protein
MEGGIFCANYGYQPFGSKTCLKCWCPTCYWMDTTVDFLVWRKKDPVTGLEIVDEGDERRHKEARPGDALICPFECDDCASFWLERKWPEWTDPGEKFLGAYIRQANLDVFHSRANNTVSQNLREFKEQAIQGESFGFAAFDPIGPFDRAYDSGMRAALGVLFKSQKPGKHEDKIKFSAARRARTIHTNVFKASARGHTLSLFVQTDKKRSIVSINPTDSEFYTMFTTGLEARIGQRVKRDCAVSIELVVELQRMSEEAWIAAAVKDDIKQMYDMSRWTTYFLWTFCHSLRGWETPRAIISQLRSQIVDEDEAILRGIPAHYGLPLYGRFKSCGNSNAQLLCMIAASTASGLEPLKWLLRLLDCMERILPRSDWLFQTRNGDKLSMTDFDDMFYEALLDIQKRRKDIIDDKIDVLEDYFLARSFRRGATTRAQLADVPETRIVNWVNHWGTGTEILVKGPLRVIYSERKLMLSHFLKFSGAL